MRAKLKPNKRLLSDCQKRHSFCWRKISATFSSRRAGRQAFFDGSIMKHTIVVGMIATALYGCASMYGTPEQRRQANAALPDYSLCENLAVATLAPSEIRSEWAMELQQRGADCSKYSGMLNNAVQQNQRMMNMGLQMMQQPSYAPSSTSGGVTCFKQSEWTSGFNKNCVYNCLGSEAVQTIGATQLCPLSITR